MADVRPASGSSSPAVPSRPLPAARAQAIAAAQRAFFDQALAAAPTAARATQAAAPVTAAPEPPRVTRLSFDPAAPATERPLRPGSLLDIKV